MKVTGEATWNLGTFGIWDPFSINFSGVFHPMTKIPGGEREMFKSLRCLEVRRHRKTLQNWPAAVAPLKWLQRFPRQHYPERGAVHRPLRAAKFHPPRATVARRETGELRRLSPQETEPFWAEVEDRNPNIQKIQNADQFSFQMFSDVFQGRLHRCVHAKELTIRW